MELSIKSNNLFNTAYQLAKKEGHEFITPEHLMLAYCTDPCFKKAAKLSGISLKKLEENLMNFMKENFEQADGEPELSKGAKDTLDKAILQAFSSEKRIVESYHILYCLMELEECFAVYYLSEETDNLSEFFSIYITECETEKSEDKILSMGTREGKNGKRKTDDDVIHFGGEGDFQEGPQDDFFPEFDFDEFEEDPEAQENRLKQYVTCLNESANDHNPLIGREEELERTIQILCCLDKNNPLHIGEAGTGKTSIAYGLAKRIVDGKVPEFLANARIYMLDLAGVVAGTQYRGQFEERLRDIMGMLSKEVFPIVFIDELHAICGAGDSSGSMDAAGLLKPWFEDPHMRFMGTTTHEEYNRSIAKNAGLVRRFQNVEINEPSHEECIRILEGIRSRYEEHHGIIYGPEFMEKAVELSARYMNDRFLPDKAISLIDEAGAWLQIHPEAADGKTNLGKPICGTDILDMTISRICRIPREQLSDNEEEKLVSLKPRMEKCVFGQEEALEKTTYAVLTSRLGLNELHKPVASLLFVGPTGVGKTETAKALAEELGISFLRYDMSEYAEKHTIAKFIGAPAGYVGFEDGGQLTNDIRKNPHCVLLLDEIEKAHSDIYNVLLQVMDYATLTDSHGKKADFSHVILIMTSNAGAASVGRNLIGFGERSVLESNMLDEVKRVFTPEFRNRLSDIIVFNHLSKDMAKRIVEKELALFAANLANRNLEVNYHPSVYEFILEKGYSREYGAREIKRVVQDQLKPVFVKALLDGSLKNLSQIEVLAEDEKLILKDIRDDG